MVSPLVKFSSQSTALSMLRSGGSGLFQPKQNIAQQTASLLAALERPASEGAAQLLKRTQQSQNILQQMDSSKSDVNEQRKAAAAEKVQRIKQKLATLRLIASINPEAAAKQAAQLSRELAQAVREYSASSGGAPISGATVPVPTDTQADAQATGATSETPVQSAPVEEATKTISAEETQTPDDAPLPGNPESVRQSLEDIGEEESKENFQDKVQENINASAAVRAKALADGQFSKDVEDVKNSLKKILESVKRKLQEKDNQSADQDIKAADGALREVGSLLANISSSAIGALAAPVNILV